MVDNVLLLDENVLFTHHIQSSKACFDINVDIIYRLLL